MTNAEAWFNIALRPRKPEGSLGRTVQDGHLDSHTAPELYLQTCCQPTLCSLCKSSVKRIACSQVLHVNLACTTNRFALSLCRLVRDVTSVYFCQSLVMFSKMDLDGDVALWELRVGSGALLTQVWIPRCSKGFFLIFSRATFMLCTTPAVPNRMSLTSARMSLNNLIPASTGSLFGHTKIQHMLDQPSEDEIWLPK